MKKVIFGGAYGISSQGDDASLIVMVEGLRRHISAFEGVVIMRHAQENPYALCGLRSVQNIEYEHKSESIGKWFYGFNYGDDRSHLKLLQEEIGSSDLLVLGAGNFLVDLTIDLLRGPIPYLVILTLMAKMTGTPVMWFGISVGPFRTDYGRRLSRLAASLADVITVRDHQACIELRQLGYSGPITQLPDPVLGLCPPHSKVANAIASWREAHQRSGPVIAVSVRDMPSGSVLGTQQYVESMATVCDSLVSHHNATLLFIPQCTSHHGNASQDDRNVARWVVNCMQHAGNAVIVSEELTVEQCLSLYSRAEIALCTRLHANVYAAIQGVPSVAISYNPKVAGFMHWLGCDDLNILLSNFSPQVILDKIETILSRRSIISNALLTRIAQGRTEVKKYASIAHDLIMPKGRCS